MALLFMDSFDHYVTADLIEKWTSSASGFFGTVAINATGGRRGSGSFRFALTNNNSNGFGGLAKTLTPSDATGIMGFAVTIPVGTVGTVGMALASLRDSGTAQVTLRANSNNTISVVRGLANGTVLGTTTATFTSGVFFHIEWKVAIHPSAGTVDVRLNGTSVLSLTGQNTRATANTSWNGVVLGFTEQVSNSASANNTNTDFDDLYVLDGSGAAPWNAFLGDCRVDVRNPTAAGATTGWTPSTGSNWQNVDDAAPNDDTDYNSTSTTNAVDTFVVQDAPVVGATIFGIQHCLSMKKMDAGTCSVAPVVRHSGVDYVGSDISPSTSYSRGLLRLQEDGLSGAIVDGLLPRRLCHRWPQ
jgi:hypothetical protein